MFASLLLLGKMNIFWNSSQSFFFFFWDSFRSFCESHLFCLVCFLLSDLWFFVFEFSGCWSFLRLLMKIFVSIVGLLYMCGCVFFVLEGFLLWSCWKSGSWHWLGIFISMPIIQIFVIFMVFYIFYIFLLCLFLLLFEERMIYAWTRYI